MHHYPNDVLYSQIINEFSLNSLDLPVTRTNRFRLCANAFTSGFVAGWLRALLPEHWLEQQLRLVAYSARKLTYTHMRC